MSIFRQEIEKLINGDGTPKHKVPVEFAPYYQIVGKIDIEGVMAGTFIITSEIYSSYEKAYKNAERLIISEARALSSKQPYIQHRIEEKHGILRIIDSRTNDIKTEYWIQELSLVS